MLGKDPHPRFGTDALSEPNVMAHDQACGERQLMLKAHDAPHPKWAKLTVFQMELHGILDQAAKQLWQQGQIVIPLLSALTGACTDMTVKAKLQNALQEGQHGSLMLADEHAAICQVKFAVIVCKQT